MGWLGEPVQKGDKGVEVYGKLPARCSKKKLSGDPKAFPYESPLGLPAAHVLDHCGTEEDIKTVLIKRQRSGLNLYKLQTGVSLLQMSGVFDACR